MRDRRWARPEIGPAPRSRVWLRRVARLAACGAALLVLGLVASGYVAYRVDAFAQGAFRPDDAPAVVLPSDPAGTPADQPADATPVTLGYGASPPVARLRAGQPLNILLLGYGGPGHDGAYLTDSMAVASLDPVTGTIAFISVPRDLWVQIPATADGRGGYWGKINQALAVGMGDGGDYATGGALASRAVAQVLGIPIDAWVGLDFVGFRQFIDTLGGVDVEVAQTFTDDHYPNNDDANIDPSYKTIHFDAGMQHMDGETALEFARSRYSPQDGSDFGRSRRQQQVLHAFALLDALHGHFYTSFSLAEVRDLAGWAQEQAGRGRTPRVVGGALDTSVLLVGDTSADGQDILLPAAGQGDYGAIHEYVRGLLADPGHH
jgi:LCP family protein required for cell wall assembly